MRRLVAALLSVALVSAACSWSPGRDHGPFRVDVVGARIGSLAAPTPEQWALVATRVLDVRFVSPRNGFLLRCVEVGGSCPRELLVTHDGGRTWSPVPGAEPLLGFDFVTRRIGFGMRSSCRGRMCRGRVFRTDDGGRTWRSIASVSVRDEPRVFGGTDRESFADPRHGLLSVGGRLFRTHDGGRTWKPTPLRCPRWATALGGLSLASPAAGYASCEGEPATDMAGKALFRTDDGGRSWRLVSSVPTPPDAARPRGDLPIIGSGTRLEFTTARRGFLMAGGLGIERTTNGGRHFGPLLFTGDGDSVTGTSWLSPRIGYVAIFQSGLLRTIDGGTMWEQVYPPTLDAPAGMVAFGSPTFGIGVTTRGYFNDPGAILTSSDGGRTWTRRTSLHGVEIGSFTFPAPGSVIASGGATRGAHRYVMLHSDDSGVTWREIPGPSRWTLPPSFIDGATGFAVDRGSGKLFRTDDGGATWSEVSVHDGLESLGFSSRNAGWALRYRSDVAGDHVALLRTFDGGVTWRWVPIPADVRLFSLEVLDERNVWLGIWHCTTTPTIVEDGRRRPWCEEGAEAAILRTSDGGSTWEMIRFPTRDAFELNFVTPEIGFTQRDRFLFRTDDGGVTWSIVGPA